MVQTYSHVIDAMQFLLVLLVSGKMFNRSTKWNLWFAEYGAKGLNYFPAFNNNNNNNNDNIYNFLNLLFTRNEDISLVLFNGLKI